MIRTASCLTLLIASCLFAGCGPASGIQPGIPKDLTPVNPTPDMAPNPPATKT